MREITVNYLLSDEDEQRLNRIVEFYSTYGYNFSADKLFEHIMCLGCKYDIDKKFRFHEFKLGLREHYN